jgi:ATP/maltotriose-dependent transcriptional regulator MalT/DNA-binding SARP family transcriptional activator
LTIVQADAGFGKSSLVSNWASAVPSVWYSVGPGDRSLPVFVRGIADAFERTGRPLTNLLRAVVHASLGPDGNERDRVAPLASLLCESLEKDPVDIALIFDDLNELGTTGPSVQLLEEICRQAPPSLHLVLVSRSAPPFRVERLRGRGEVVDIDAAMLALEPAEVAGLLENLFDRQAADLAPEVFELTAGWPAAVRLVVEALRPVAPAERLSALGALRSPGGRLFSYLAEEVFAQAPAEVRELLRRVAPFRRFNVDFCRAIGIEMAADSLVTLRRSGLFIDSRGERDWFVLHSLVQEFVHEQWPLAKGEERELHARAADWFEIQGFYEEALESLLAAGNETRAADMLEAHGPALVASGKVESAIRIAGRLPRKLRGRAIDQLVGEAHEVRGEWDEALTCFQRAAGNRKRLDAALAWRMGLIHHLRGELDQALDAYQRGDPSRSNARESALLLTWTASAHWLRGDATACRDCAEEAFVQATASEDAGALASAHTVLAMLAAMSGDRLANDAHYLRALEYAERAGDLLQSARVRTNRGSRHLEEGEYEQALTELELAIRLADLTGFAFFRALALTNRGEVHFRLGRLEEAITDLDASKSLYQKTGSRMVSYPLTLLGDVYQERGDRAIAQAHYEEAIRSAEQAGDVQGLVPALCGLAQLVATDEPDRARTLARRARSFGEGMGEVAAGVASGWVALSQGDREEAASEAEEAAAAARLRRDRAGLAQALELSGLATPDQAQRTARLEEAISLWRGIGNPLGEARSELFLAATSESPELATRAEAAERTLAAAGARGYRVLLASLAPRSRGGSERPLSITTLGRFAVRRQGQVIGSKEWQSKKARDLLKIIVSRRDKPTPRDALMEALWPEDDPRRLSNRLSVALSTLRSLLDPSRHYPSDHFIATAGGAIGLRRENIDLDIDAFLAAGKKGLDLCHTHDSGAARLALEAAEASYLGDFLEEDLYEDWAAPLREEARALYLEVTSVLADLCDNDADADAAIRYRLRVLERDPYDEYANLGLTEALIRSGRHGEARRAYRRYVSRMAEIGVEATPFPPSPSRQAAAL